MGGACFVYGARERGVNLKMDDTSVSSNFSVAKS